METPPTLIDRLRECALAWVEINDASLARLGRTVVNDGGFFSRLDSPRGTTTATLEKFAAYLNDPAVWAGNDVPEVVRAFAHVVGISGEAGGSSPDSSPGGIGDTNRAEEAAQ